VTKWGIMYEGLKTENKWQVMTNAIFMIRRLVFLFTCFYLVHSVALQILALNFLNLFVMMYTASSKALDLRYNNRLNLFNEICVTVIGWHLMFFTGLVTDLNMQFTMGWSMVAWISFNTGVNILIVIWHAFKTMWLAYERAWVMFDFAVYGIERKSGEDEIVEAPVVVK
jgi:hypothetical protein